MGVGDSSRLNNLRFADAVLLIARTKKQLTTMLLDVCREAGRCGLQLHPEKTKILTTASKKSGRCNHVIVGDMKIEVLDAEEHVKYLGSYICCERRQEVELKRRIRAAWAKFASHKQELTNKKQKTNLNMHLKKVLHFQFLDHPQ